MSRTEYNLSEFVEVLRKGISNGVSNGVSDGLINQFNRLVESYREYCENHDSNGKSIVMDVPINSPADVLHLSELERLGFIHFDVINPATDRSSQVTITEAGRHHFVDYENRILSYLADQFLARSGHDPAEI